MKSRFADIVELTDDTPWPDCRDWNDRVFLALALQAQADTLVTGDGDLLACKADFPLPILPPDELKQQLKETGPAGT